MEGMMKNLEFSTAVNLADEVSYRSGEVASKTLAQNGAVSLTLFSFDEGEEISSHVSDGDALVLLLDGEAEITVGGGKFRLTKGQAIAMPAGVPHALFAAKRFKMLLTVVFPKS